MPWSRMAVLVRSTSALLGRAAAGADHGRRAGRRARRGPAAGRAAGGRACCSRSCAACSIRPRLDRGRRRAAAARPDRRRRRRLPAPAAAGAARRSSARTSRCCSRRPCSTRPAQRCCPSTCARPVERVARRARRRRGRASTTRAPAPRTCCGRCGTPSGPGAAVAGGEQRRRSGRAPRPTAISTRSSSCSTPPRASPTGCPRATLAGFTEHLAAQQIPGDALARGAPRDRGGDHPHRARQQGPRVGSRLRRARAGGQLARPAPARLAARLRAARRRRRRPRHAPSRCRPSRRSWPRSGGCSTSRPPAPAQRLVVTAVAGDEEQPSRFLDELDPVDGERPLDRSPGAARTSAALVAELRAVVCDPARRPDRPRGGGRRAGAAGRRPACAAPTPTSGGGSRRCPTTGRSPTRIDRCRSARRASSPSCAASCARCCRISARATATRSRSRSARSSTRSPRPRRRTRPRTTSKRVLDEQWHAPRLRRRTGSRATSDERASRILAGCCDWLRDSRARARPRRRSSKGSRPSSATPQLAGRVDRLERDAEGRLVVIDLKTGKTKVKADDLPTHPQLAAYQLAVEAGAFGEGERTGGARLVQLAAAGTRPRAAAGAAGRVPTTRAGSTPQVAHVAARMRGSEFTATANSDCGNCDLQNLLPAVSRGPAGDVVIVARIAQLELATARAATRRPPSRRRSSSRRSRRPSSSPAPGRARPRRWPRGSCGWSPTGWSVPTRCSG